MLNINKRTRWSVGRLVGWVVRLLLCLARFRKYLLSFSERGGLFAVISFCAKRKNDDNKKSLIMFARWYDKQANKQANCRPRAQQRHVIDAKCIRSDCHLGDRRVEVIGNDHSLLGWPFVRNVSRRHFLSQCDATLRGTSGSSMHHRISSNSARWTFSPFGARSHRNHNNRWRQWQNNDQNKRFFTFFFFLVFRIENWVSSCMICVCKMHRRHPFGSVRSIYLCRK